MDALNRAGTQSDADDRVEAACDDSLGQQVDEAVTHYAAVRRPRTVGFEEEDLPF